MRQSGQANVNTPISDATGLAMVVTVGAGTLGFGGLYNPVKDQDNTFQYIGSMTWSRSNHNIKTGAALIRRQLTSFQSSYGEGLWIFLGLPNLLQGNVFEVQRALSLVVPHIRVWEPSVYIQDDWHVARNLTLNLGLRYDLYTPFTEISNAFPPSIQPAATCWSLVRMVFQILRALKRIIVTWRRALVLPIQCIRAP